MYKMVIQAVMLTAAAVFFIFFKSDNLRHASQTGDLSALTSGAVRSAYADIDMSGPDPVYSQPFYKKYDPRKLWSERPKTVRLSPKSIRVEPAQAGADVTAALREKGVNPDTVSVVKLK
ncbi:hypothetical protein [Celeribacter sp.]|uniref:hypothetical protein n=1 Tax=Celeribacter sp. TaxID=1890673 RepID=UPI003A8D6AB0